MAKSGRDIRAGRAFVELSTRDNLTRGLRSAQRQLQSFGKAIGGIGLRMAGLGTAVLAPMLMATRVFSDIGSRLDDISQRTGVAVESLSELGYAAEQNGSSLESLGNTLFRMNRRIANAATGSGPAVRALRELGLSAETLSQLGADDQLKVLADRLNAVENPALAAQYAFEILGDNAKELMPLMRQGSRGIVAFQAEAKQLGLTVSQDAANAASAFADATDRLWRVIEAGVFAIGSALAPALTDLAGRISAIAVMIGDWLRQNQALILQVAQVAAMVVAAGLTIAGLGATIIGIGAVFGGLATIVTVVGAAMAAMKVAVLALLSPIGLVTAAIVGIGAYLLHATGAGAEALTWLGGRFHALRDTALAAYRGIADALAAGDIGLAAKVLWLTLKVEWTKGINYLKGLWLDLRHFLADVLVDAFTGTLAALEIVWHGLETAWIETTAFLTTAWHGFVNIFLRTWEEMKAVATKAWNWIKGLFSDSINVEIANAEVDRALDQRLSEIDQTTGEAVIGTELRRQTRRDRAASIHEQTMAAIGSGYDADPHQAKQRAKADQEAEQSLLDARREWEAAIAEAKQKRSELPESDDGPNHTSLEDYLARIQDGLAGAAQTAADATKQIAAGTFNAFAIQSLQGGDSIAERTARATEETAANTKRMERNTREAAGLAVT